MPRQFGSGAVGQGEKAKMILFFGIFVLFLVAALVYLVATNTSSTPPVLAPPPTPVEPIRTIQTVNVLVPVRDIQQGEPLQPQMFVPEGRPAAGVPKEAVRSYEQIKGFYAKTVIVAGQPLGSNDITSTRPTNAFNIPPGYRAVTIRVDATSGVEGWARPGSSVDVTWTRSNSTLITIVSDAKVLSADRSVNSNTGDQGMVPSTVTLLVTTEDASKIALAQTTGSLNLLLRGDDSGEAEGGVDPGGRTITLGDLGRTGGAPVVQEQPCEGHVVVGGEKFCLRNGNLVPMSKM